MNCLIFVITHKAQLHDINTETTRTTAKTVTDISTQATMKPFPFLDLPAELRLMVYERIPLITRHQICDYLEANGADLRNYKSNGGPDPEKHNFADSDWKHYLNKASVKKHGESRTQTLCLCKDSR